jgi:predicted proteasome-type protease
VKITLAVPYEQTVDSVVSVRSTARASVEITLPDDMSATERGHFQALLANALDHADVQDYITDLTPVW